MIRSENRRKKPKFDKFPVLWRNRHKRRAPAANPQFRGGREIDVIHDPFYKLSQSMAGPGSGPRTIAGYRWDARMGRNS